MSGIEVAGLVLGAVPILIELIDTFRTGFRKSQVPFRKRKYVDKLANALLLHSQIVKDTLRLLIVHGCSIYDEEMFSGDPMRYLEDQEVQQNIMKFLGQEKYAVLVSTMQDIGHTLEKVANQLSDAVPDFKNPSLDLSELVKANKNAKSHQMHLGSRWKLMWSYSDIKQKTEDLGATTSALQQFATLVLQIRSIAPATDPPSTPGRLSRALRRVRLLVTHLYSELSRCCGDAVCHRKHEADMLLEDRLNSATDLLHLVRRSRDDKDDSTLIVFRILFAAVPIHAWWHEVPIRILKPHQDDDVDTLESSMCAVRISSPQLSTPVLPDAGLKMIDNFCTVIQTAGQAQAPSFIALVLSEARKLNTVNVQERTILCQDQGKRVTLDEILSSPEHIPLGIMFAPKWRMLLALRLASNLLQLSQTRWLDRAWTKETIYFVLHPADNTSTKTAVDFSRAFVPAVIDRTPSGSGPEPKIALLELGILLLELWHYRTLEARFDLDSPPTEYYDRLLRAVEWLDDSSNPLPVLYESAISYCIKANIGDQSRTSSWSANELWDSICRDVIQPLSENCMPWNEMLR